MTGVFAGAVAASEVVRRRRGRELPERIGAGDLALMAVATYKLSRLATKARVTSFARAPFTRYTGEAGPSEVTEEPRGTGLRRAVGELAVCPYCIGEWIAAGLMTLYVHDPRADPDRGRRARRSWRPPMCCTRGGSRWTSAPELGASEAQLTP